MLRCGAKPLGLCGFPSSIFSVTAKQERVVGTALELSSSGFLCLINGCHVPCLEQGRWHRGTWRYSQGGSSHPWCGAGCELAQLVWWGSLLPHAFVCLWPSL